MKFRNPANGYEEECDSPGLWCLLFGCLYFVFKGIWTHATIAFVLAIITYGLSWLIYPFFAADIVERHYLRRGWEKVPTTSLKDSAKSPDHLSFVRDDSSGRGSGVS